MDLDPESAWIIDLPITLSQIYSDHRSFSRVRREIHLDVRSKIPFCVGIHKNLRSRNINTIF